MHLGNLHSMIPSHVTCSSLMSFEVKCKFIHKTLVTNNFATLNHIVTKLGSQIHLLDLHAMMLSRKGHILRSYECAKFKDNFRLNFLYSQHALMTINFPYIVSNATKLSSGMLFRDIDIDHSWVRHNPAICLVLIWLYIDQLKERVTSYI